MNLYNQNYGFPYYQQYPNPYQVAQNEQQDNRQLPTSTQHQQTQHHTHHQTHHHTHHHHHHHHHHHYTGTTEHTGHTTHTGHMG